MKLDFHSYWHFIVWMKRYWLAYRWLNILNLILGTIGVVLSLCFVPAAVGITFATFFQALGYGMYSLIVTLLRQVIVLLPAAWIFSEFAGVTGVWLSFPFAEIFSLICSIVFYIRINRKEISVMPEGNS